MNLPNKLTVARVLMVPFFVMFFFWGNFTTRHYYIALAIFIAASLTDLADGKIARKRGLITDFGKMMDPLADKMLVMAAMICMLSVQIVHPVVVIVILAREFLVTSIRLIAAGKGVIIAADSWGKVKTVFQMIWICAGLLLLAIDHYYFPLPSVVEAVRTVYFALIRAVTVLTVISGFKYVWQNRMLFDDL